MNQVELNSIFAEMEPTNSQKRKMLECIINTNEISIKKNFKTSKILKIVATFALIICLMGTTANATGLLDNMLGSYHIYNNFVSWATNEDLLTGNEDIQDATSIHYNKIYTYKNINVSLKDHDINIAFPKSVLLTEDLNGVTIKISNDNPDIELINLQKNYTMENKMVQLNIDCYKILSKTSSALELGISTSQHADKTNKYCSKSGVTFTLLESIVNDKPQTVANVMIKDNKQIYLYSIKITDESEKNINELLDSFDFSIYTTK